MPHVLEKEEETRSKAIGRLWDGRVVVQSGKRRLRETGSIIVTWLTEFVPLPEDVKVFDERGEEIVPVKSLFISRDTTNPHIIVEAWCLPISNTETIE